MVLGGRAAWQGPLCGGCHSPVLHAPTCHDAPALPEPLMTTAGRAVGSSSGTAGRCPCASCLLEPGPVPLTHPLAATWVTRGTMRCFGLM